MSYLSGTRTWETNRDYIIKTALRKVGAYYQGGNPNSYQINEAAFTLNSMVKSWHNFGVMLWSEFDDQTSLVDGTASYTLSSGILGLSNFFLRDSSNYDTPVEIINKDEYVAIPTKNSSGKPFQVFIEYLIGSTVLYLYYVPDSSYELHYTKELLVQDFNSAGNTPDFPVTWSDALIYGLACQLADEYGIPLQERQLLCTKAATFLHAAIQSYKEGSGDMQVSPELSHWRRMR